MTTPIQKVTICGSGVLGTQIAYQSAFHGCQVRVYDINDEAISKAKATVEKLQGRYQQDLKATPEQTQAAAGRIQYFTDLAQAVQGSELVIEAVPERLDIKRDFYSKLAQVAGPDTIFASNSSTLLPSAMRDATGRPDKFLALHFANEIWKQNTAEVMGTDQTAPEVFERVMDFARSIGMVALPLHKEQPGYILNSLLVPLINSALGLVVGGVAEPQTVDKTWMLGTGAPVGPFAMLDVIGLTTPYNINMALAEKSPAAAAAANYLKENFIDKGKLGVATGEGFYKYPNPAFREKDFLK